jgi:hypothetical protein
LPWRISLSKQQQQQQQRQQQPQPQPQPQQGIAVVGRELWWLEKGVSVSSNNASFASRPNCAKLTESFGRNFRQFDTQQNCSRKQTKTNDLAVTKDRLFVCRRKAWSLVASSQFFGSGNQSLCLYQTWEQDDGSRMSLFLTTKCRLGHCWHLAAGGCRKHVGRLALTNNQSNDHGSAPEFTSKAQQQLAFLWVPNGRERSSCRSMEDAESDDDDLQQHAGPTVM